MQMKAITRRSSKNGVLILWSLCQTLMQFKRKFTFRAFAFLIFQFKVFFQLQSLFLGEYFTYLYGVFFHKPLNSTAYFRIHVVPWQWADTRPPDRCILEIGSQPYLAVSFSTRPSKPCFPEASGEGHRPPTDKDIGYKHYPCHYSHIFCYAGVF